MNSSIVGTSAFHNRTVNDGVTSVAVSVDSVTETSATLSFYPALEGTTITVTWTPVGTTVASGNMSRSLTPVLAYNVTIAGLYPGVEYQVAVNTEGQSGTASLTTASSNSGFVTVNATTSPPGPYGVTVYPYQYTPSSGVWARLDINSSGWTVVDQGTTTSSFVISIPTGSSNYCASVYSPSGSEQYLYGDNDGYDNPVSLTSSPQWNYNFLGGCKKFTDGETSYFLYAFGDGSNASYNGGVMPSQSILDASGSTGYVYMCTDPDILLNGQSGSTGSTGSTVTSSTCPTWSYLCQEVQQSDQITYWADQSQEPSNQGTTWANIGNSLGNLFQSLFNNESPSIAPVSQTAPTRSLNNAQISAFPSLISLKSAGETSLKIHWSGGALGDAARIEYKPWKSFASPLVKIVSGNAAELTNLRPCTEYQIDVQIIRNGQIGEARRARFTTSRSKACSWNMTPLLWLLVVIVVILILWMVKSKM